MGWLSNMSGGRELDKAGGFLEQSARVGLDWNRFSRGNTIDRERNFYQNQGSREVDRINKDLAAGRQDIFGSYNAGTSAINRSQVLANQAIGSNTANLLGQISRSGSTGSALLSGLRDLGGQANTSYLQNASQGASAAANLAGQRMSSLGSLASQFGALKANAVDSFSNRGLQAGQQSYENAFNESLKKRSMEQEVFQAKAQAAQMRAANKQAVFSTVAGIVGAPLMGGITGALGGAMKGLGGNLAKGATDAAGNNAPGFWNSVFSGIGSGILGGGGGGGNYRVGATATWDGTKWVAN